jgi:endonuclease/exonuclease/phosphatase family metal-dependent hydrolase
VRGFDADVVVVPESWRDDDGVGMLDALRDDGYDVVTDRVHGARATARTHNSDRRIAVPRDGTWELAVCSRLPVLDRRLIPIGTSRPTRPGLRHAISLTVSVGGTPVEVIGVHVSSKVWRLAPQQHLLTLRRGIVEGGPQVLAGDFNFWGPPTGALMPGWDRPVRGRTYPAWRPHSQIDHVFVRGGIESLGGEVLGATPSDHRPDPRPPAARGAGT